MASKGILFRDARRWSGVGLGVGIIANQNSYCQRGQGNDIQGWNYRLHQRGIFPPYTAQTMRLNKMVSRQLK